MNRTNKAKYPMIAALFSSKVLKETKTGAIVVRGHETMKVELRFKPIEREARRWWPTTTETGIFCKNELICDFDLNESIVLLALFSYTFESKESFARVYLTDKLADYSVSLAAKFSTATKPE